MLIKGIIYIISTILSAVLYRMGGSLNYNKLYRRLGCMVLHIPVIWMFGWHWSILLCLPLIYGALTTYHDYLTGGKEDWKCWLMTGFCYSLSLLPYVWFTGLWSGFIIRTIVLAVATMIWSEKIGNAVWEESGRGALIMLTLPLLYL